METATMDEQRAASADAAVEKVLEVRGLNVAFRSAQGWTSVVEDVSLDVGRGEVVGLVGESGSGKTMTAMAVLGLAQLKGARVSADVVRLAGRDVQGLAEKDWGEIRGRDVGMIFQQPIRSLNPAFTVGDQIAEVVRRHTGASRKAAWDVAVSMLDRVHIADARKRASEYPHTFSGGMCQRVMIAMALACGPKLLIADEPTTALDVTVQARVLDLLLEVQRDTGVAILFITHDLGVIAEMCDRVAVMYAGQVVEVAPVEPIFDEPGHPYTDGLLASIPRVGSSKRLVSIPGAIPAPTELPPGCRFHPRCTHAVPGRCDTEAVGITSTGDGRDVRCVRFGELTLGGEVGA